MGTKSWFRQPRYSVLHLAGTVAGVTIFCALYLTWMIDRWFMPRMAAVAAATSVATLPSEIIARRQIPAIPARYRQNYRFIEKDAFSWNLPLWSKLLAPYVGKPNVNYLEVGLAEGRSCLWMMENVLTDNTAHATGVDIFQGEARERFFANLRLSGAADRVTVINQPSQIALRSLPLESFDLIYVDGSHVKSDVLEDILLSWRLLKPNGLLILDDYEHVRSSGLPEEYECPKVAIDAFYACFDRRCEVIHKEYQVVIRKTHE